MAGSQMTKPPVIACMERRKVLKSPEGIRFESSAALLFSVMRQRALPEMS